MHEYFEVFAIRGGGIVGAGSWSEEMPSTSASSMLCCSRELRIFMAGGVEDVSS